ncbi:MAG: hypothetical protein ACW98U_10430 [Candidatus Thorarchaeota archaeon]|jgi:hypothetical protein
MFLSGLTPRIKLLLLMTLLFFSTLGFLIPLYQDVQPEVREGKWHEIEDVFWLTSSNPRFELDIYSFYDDFRIEALHTNGSPVTISARSGYNDTSHEYETVYFLLTNVTRIENVHLVIDDYPYEWDSIVSFIRQDEDVLVTLRGKIWDRYPSDVFWAAIPNPLVFILGILAVWRISRLKDAYKSWFLSSLVIVIVVGAVLIVPWIGGSLGDQFSLVYQEEFENRQFLSYKLNTSSPNVSIDLTGFSVGPDYEMRIHNLSTNSIPVFLRVQDVSESVLLSLDNISGLGHCGLILSDSGNPNYTLEIQSLSQDAPVGFTVESVRRVLVPYSDSFPSIMLSLLGSILFAISILVAYRTDMRAREGC